MVPHDRQHGQLTTLHYQGFIGWGFGARDHHEAI